MSSGGFQETTPPVVRCLLVCDHIRYDSNAPNAAYTLENVLAELIPAEGSAFPLELPEAWLFFQAQGDAGTYDLMLDLVRLDDEGEDADEATTWGPMTLLISEGAWIESRGWALAHLPPDAPGEYELRLWCGRDLLARTSFLVREA